MAMAIGVALNCALLLPCAATEKPNYPTTGPKVQAGKHIVFVAENFKNGGIVGVYRSLEAASRLLGWQLDIVDGAGQSGKQAALLDTAIATHPDAIVFGGFDATKFETQVAAAQKAKIILVGWHAAKDPGPTPSLFVNVATSTQDVGKMAADFVIQDPRAAGKKLGVIIFNDDQFAVASAKAQRMTETINACASYTDCKVLATVNVHIADADARMPEVATTLLGNFGSAWNYSLAINDIYFDQLDAVLGQLKRKDVLNVSAGDGSAKAMARIASGQSQQIGSIAEPLKLQGYQLADELNRAFAGLPPSGFKSKPIMVTVDLLKTMGKHGVESNQGFESAYTGLWGKK